MTVEAAEGGVMAHAPRQQPRRAPAVAGEHNHLGVLKALDSVGVVIHDARGHAVLVGRDLTYPTMSAQFNASAARGRPVSDVGARFRPLRAGGCAMAQID